MWLVDRGTDISFYDFELDGTYAAGNLEVEVRSEFNVVFYRESRELDLEDVDFLSLGDLRAESSSGPGGEQGSR